MKARIKYVKENILNDVKVAKIKPNENEMHQDQTNCTVMTLPAHIHKLNIRIRDLEDPLARLPPGKFPKAGVKCRTIYCLFRGAWDPLGRSANL